MKRTTLALIASETLSVLADGHYRNRSGNNVTIRKSLDACIGGTKHWRPAELESLIASAVADSRPIPQTTFEVVNETTLVGAKALVDSGDFQYVAALNFASAKHAGGGFIKGAQAQEESLARVSGVFSSLRQAPEFYDFHRKQRDALYSDRMIWSPRCPVFRDDEGHWLDVPWELSFITSAAPNAGAVKKHAPENVARIPEVLAHRAELVLALAAHHQVDALVLGAWGGGVFQNDPGMVAKAFRDLLAPGGRWQGRFRHVRFSVLDFAMPARTFDAFQDALSI